MRPREQNVITFMCAGRARVRVRVLGRQQGSDTVARQYFGRHGTYVISIVITIYGHMRADMSIGRASGLRHGHEQN